MKTSPVFNLVYFWFFTKFAICQHTGRSYNIHALHPIGHPRELEQHVFNVAFEDLKSHPDFKHLDITTDVLDDHKDTAYAAYKVTEYCAKKDDRITIIVGPEYSSVVEGAQIPARESNCSIPQISCCSTASNLSNKKTYPTAYRIPPTDSKQAPALVNLVRRVLNYKDNHKCEIALINTGDNYSTDFKEEFETIWNNMTNRDKYEPLKTYSLPQFEEGRSSQFVSRVQTIREEASVLILLTNGGDTNNLFSEFKNQTNNTGDYIIFGGDGWMDDEAVLGNVTQTQSLGTAPFLDVDNPKYVKLLEDVAKSANNTSISRNTYYAYTYDAIEVGFRAIAQLDSYHSECEETNEFFYPNGYQANLTLGNCDKLQSNTTYEYEILHEIISNIEFQGITGDVKFDANGDGFGEDYNIFSLNNKQWEKIATSNPNSFDFDITNDDFKWPVCVPKKEKESDNMILFIVISVLAAAIVLLGIGCFHNVYRQKGKTLMIDRRDLQVLGQLKGRSKFVYTATWMKKSNWTCHLRKTAVRVVIKVMKESESVDIPLKELDLYPKLGTHERVEEFIGICHNFFVGRVKRTAFVCKDSGFCFETYIKDRLNIGNLISEQEFVDFAIQMADALTHVHKKSIAHRDIHSSNFAINRRKKLTLIDFGYSRHVTANGYNGGITHLRWRMCPPEYCIENNKNWSLASDVWMFGISLWSLWCQVHGKRKLEPFSNIYEPNEMADVHLFMTSVEKAFVENGGRVPLDFVTLQFTHRLQDIIEKCCRIREDERILMSAAKRLFEEYKGEAGVHNTIVLMADGCSESHSGESKECNSDNFVLPDNAIPPSPTAQYTTIYNTGLAENHTEQESKTAEYSHFSTHDVHSGLNAEQVLELKTPRPYQEEENINNQILQEVENEQKTISPTHNNENNIEQDEISEISSVRSDDDGPHETVLSINVEVSASPNNESCAPVQFGYFDHLRRGIRSSSGEFV